MNRVDGQRHSWQVGSSLTSRSDTVGEVPPDITLHTNRLRANSFGGEAPAYDAHRPRYPDALIDDLLGTAAGRVLDVGAGTGIASQQLAERGADVLAVEPDARMASLARVKGIPVELDTFERWDPAGRSFELVVFAASFHWVDPAVALPKVRSVLRPGGRLALLWNRLKPLAPTHEDFAAIYDDYMERDSTRAHRDFGALTGTLSEYGYSVTTHSYPRHVEYTRDQWLNWAFTHSNHLVLPAAQAAELRQRLSDRIGDGGVTVGGDSLAIVATPD
jgi:SAM-dependent methyltransferase